MKLTAQKQQETHFGSNNGKEQWIEDYVERETAGARKQVEDPEAAVEHEQEHMKHDEIARLMTRQPEKAFKQMMVALEIV
jgi:hypothetical protein